MQQNRLTAFNLNACIVMSFMNRLWCNSELVKSLWAHSITCFWSHTSYMKTNYCWIAVNTLLKSFKKIFNSLSIMEERIWPKIEPVSQSLQTPSTQQRCLIVILYCIQEVDPLKYRSGSGSRNLIFNGSGWRLFKTLYSCSARVQLHQDVKVRVRFRFNSFKIKWFRFGSGSPEKKRFLPVRGSGLGSVRLPACFKLIKFWKAERMSRIAAHV